MAGRVDARVARLPVTASNAVSGNAIKTISAIFTTPDTAAYGTNPLKIVVTGIADPTSRDSTVVDLVGPTSGAPLVTGPGGLDQAGLPDTMPAQLVNRDDTPRDRGLVDSSIAIGRDSPTALPWGCPKVSASTSPSHSSFPTRRRPVPRR
jgi:hypothetical protein